MAVITTCPFCNFPLAAHPADANISVCTNPQDLVGKQGITREHLQILTQEPTHLPVKPVPPNAIGVPPVVAKKSH